MAQPLMPKATAVWLVENTALSFDQIADFVGLHELEVQAIADGEVAVGMQGADPISAGALTQAEIDRCQADTNASLKMSKVSLPQPKSRGKGARYTPVSKRQDRPDAIAWILKHHPEMTDAQISRLIGTTKPTISAIRDRTHWNSTNLLPRSPVEVGLCTHLELRDAVIKATERAAKNKPKLTEEEVAAAAPAAAATPASDMASAAESYSTMPKKPESEPTAEDLWPTSSNSEDA